MVLWKREVVTHKALLTNTTGGRSLMMPTELLNVTLKMLVDY